MYIEWILSCASVFTLHRTNILSFYWKSFYGDEDYDVHDDDDDEESLIRSVSLMYAVITLPSEADDTDEKYDDSTYNCYSRHYHQRV